MKTNYAYINSNEPIPRTYKQPKIRLASSVSTLPVARLLKLWDRTGRSLYADELLRQFGRGGD